MPEFALADRTAGFAGFAFVEALVGLTPLVSGTAVVLNDIAGHPVGTTPLGLAVFVLAVGGAVPFGVLGWSTAWLGNYLVGFVVGLLIVSVGGMAAIAALEYEIAGSELLLAVLLIGLSHLVALVAAVLRGPSLRPAPTAVD